MMLCKKHMLQSLWKNLPSCCSLGRNDFFLESFHLGINLVSLEALLLLLTYDKASLKVSFSPDCNFSFTSRNSLALLQNAQKFCYKMRVVTKCAEILLRNVHVLTKCAEILLRNMRVVTQCAVVTKCALTG